jgi:uncharacterized protein YndB with AHSA1/START domain
LVVNEEEMMGVVREVQIDAPPEDVWEAIATEHGRELWLGDAAEGVEVEAYEPHHRLVWTWSDERGATSTVDFRIVAIPDGSRVIVTESVPVLPIAMLASAVASRTLVLA